MNTDTRLLRTDSNHPAFKQLVTLLDRDLAERDGEEHNFYSQYNTTTTIRHVVIAMENEKAVACGAIKLFEPGSMEVKRMFTLPQERGKGLAALVLKELESWAKELGCYQCVLETGKRQPEAISLYLKCGYEIIPNYGQYTGIENSICFRKLI
jgi:GNAT superfamily N-acetyltransferase